MARLAPKMKTAEVDAAMRKVAAKAAAMQGKDGLWRVGLLDQED